MESAGRMFCEHETGESFALSVDSPEDPYGLVSLYADPRWLSGGIILILVLAAGCLGSTSTLNR